MAFANHNDMVQDADAENLAGFGELFVYPQVGLARLEIAVRVAVGEDDRGGAVGDDVGENLVGVDWAFVEQADSDNALFNNFIRAVERDANEMLSRTSRKPKF
ncbi:MAG TPA: hypothetical protein VNL14_13140 [Candidatus Acidoferrales bacterium]|nr:hypothetical protein [Candidatus Acidoferrales bacterium]